MERDFLSLSKRTCTVPSSDSSRVYVCARASRDIDFVAAFDGCSHKSIHLGARVTH